MVQKTTKAIQTILFILASLSVPTKRRAIVMSFSIE